MISFVCEIYLNDLNIESLVSNIETTSQMQFDKFLYAENDLMTLRIRKNKEYDKEMSLDKEEGFLFFPYVIELDLNDGESPKHYIYMIKKILEYLNSNKINFVVASDFEDELPKSYIS